MVTDGRYPLEIVNFSDRHGYEALENAAALLSLSYPYRDLVTKLSGSDLLRRFVSHCLGVCTGLIRIHACFLAAFSR